MDRDMHTRRNRGSRIGSLKASQAASRRLDKTQKKEQEAVQRERRNIALQIALTSNPVNFASAMRSVSKAYTRNATVLAAKHGTLLTEFAARGKLHDVRRMIESPEFRLQTTSPVRYVSIVRKACNNAFLAACEAKHMDVVIYLLGLASEAVPRVDPTMNDNAAIRMACANGNVELFTLLMSWAGPGGRRVDPTAKDNECICTASELGHTGIVAGLLSDKRVDATANNQTPLRHAVVEAHTAVVTMLLLWKGSFVEQKEDSEVRVEKAVDPTVLDNLMIQVSAMNGNTEIVRLLLSWQDPLAKEGVPRFVDATVNDNVSICYASSDGYLGVVHALLEWQGPNGLRVDPAARDNYAIRRARANGHIRVVARLREDPRVNADAV